jgi:hypothetical protein
LYPEYVPIINLNYEINKLNQKRCNDINSEFLVTNFNDSVSMHIRGGVDVSIRVDILDELGDKGSLANRVSQNANLRKSMKFLIALTPLRIGYSNNIVVHSGISNGPFGLGCCELLATELSNVGLCPQYFSFGRVASLNAFLHPLQGCLQFIPFLRDFSIA